MRYNNDTQRLREAIEAAGLLNAGGSGPIYNDKRADGKRRLKLSQAGFFPTLPLSIQWLIRDNLTFFFGDRLLSVYMLKNEFPEMGDVFLQFQPQHKFSLCVVLKD